MWVTFTGDSAYGTTFNLGQLLCAEAVQNRVACGILGSRIQLRFERLCLVGKV